MLRHLLLLHVLNGHAKRCRLTCHIKQIKKKIAKIQHQIFYLSMKDVDCVLGNRNASVSAVENDFVKDWSVLKMSDAEIVTDLGAEEVAVVVSEVETSCAQSAVAILGARWHVESVAVSEVETSCAQSAAVNADVTKKKKKRLEGTEVVSEVLMTIGIGRDLGLVDDSCCCRRHHLDDAAAAACGGMGRNANVRLLAVMVPDDWIGPCCRLDVDDEAVNGRPICCAEMGARDVVFGRCLDRDRGHGL
jgi:hypothetical protein